MFIAISQGILLGLLLAIMVGPMFFALMHIAIHTEKKYAIGFAIGTLVSDILLALLILNGALLLHEGAHIKILGGGIAGIIFLTIGIIQYRKHSTSEHVPENITTLEKSKHHTIWRYILQGFSMNSIYPGVLIFRVGTVGQFIATNHHASRLHITAFIISILVIVFCTDLLKITLAMKVKKILTKKILKIMQKITAGIMMTIGLVLLINTAITSIHRIQNSSKKATYNEINLEHKTP